MRRFEGFLVRSSLVLAAFLMACGSGASPSDSGGCPDGGCRDGLATDPGVTGDTVDDLLAEVYRDTESDGQEAFGGELGQSDLIDAATDVPSLGGFGQPCNENSDCDKELCMPSISGRFCTTTCIEKCPDGYSCRKVPFPGSEDIFACVIPDTSLCRPCSKDADCSGVEGEVSRCLGYGKIGRFCATACSAGACPTGYTCTDTTVGEDVLSLCVADLGDCPCLLGFAGLATPCFESKPPWTCNGLRTCSQSGSNVAWEACTAKVPIDEICNGEDDNCDGAKDEGLGDYVCGQGVCAHTVSNCLDGKLGQCNEYLGQTVETCNDLDDDCDGLTDEMWPDRGSPCDGPDLDKCMNGTWGCADDGQSLVCERDDVNNVEVCNNFDDDCDGLTDNNLGEKSCGVGECFHSVQNCEGGQSQTCNPLDNYKPEDLPDPAYLDTNCDGVDGDAARSIFVDITTGIDLNEGSMDLPKRTIQAGIDAAVDVGFQTVIVSLGVYNVTSVYLRNGIGIYGQYDRASGWQRKKENTTQIKGGQVAVYADDLVAPTGLHGFLITSEAPAIPGQSSYGVMARNSPGLEITSDTIQAGNGSRGIVGTDGLPGLNGNTGALGQNGCVGTGVGCTGSCNPSDSNPAGGPGGTSPCINAGGAGAYGGSADSGGNDGLAGVGPGAGYGGTGAAGTRGDGYPGGDGSNGLGGQNGTAGEWVGAFEPDGYVLGNGGDGVKGKDGSGGGGGGSGGGNVTGILEWCDRYGGGGGGGGGGGCGGGGGKGGGGGGASIGLFVYGAGIKVTDTVIKTGVGGQGGAAGRASTGGLAGPGGAGGAGITDGKDTGFGAKGGDGGSGGKGGEGGGGGGGSSIGILCGNAFVTQDQVSFIIGQAGSGGTSSSEPGLPGTNPDTYNCGL